MTPLTYCRSFPLKLNCYGITSAYELQILIWAATLPDGIRESNNNLAQVLNTDRRTIINSINRLKLKRLIDNVGTKYNRVLIASSEIVSLFDRFDGEKVSQNGEKVSQNGEKPDTHNINNLKKRNTTSDFKEETRLSELLLKLILQRNPDLKRPNIRTWAKDVGYMLRLDGRTSERIEAVIRYCQADTGNGDGWDGWQNVILSTKKLREKFDQLEMRMEKKQPKPYQVERGPDGLTNVERAKKQLLLERDAKRKQTSSEPKT